MKRFFLFLSVLFICTACKEDPPEVELLDIDLSMPVMTFVDPDADDLVGGVFDWEVYVLAKDADRYSVAGVQIGTVQTTDAYRQNIEFRMFSPQALAKGIEDWEAKFEWSDDQQGWTVRQVPVVPTKDELQALITWGQRRPLSSADAVSDFLAEMETAPELSAVVASFAVDGGDAQFVEVVEAIRAQLGASTPATLFEEGDIGEYWVTEDRLIHVYPLIKKVSVRSLRQVREGCMIVGGQLTFDVAGCDPDAVRATERYPGLPFPPL